MTRISPSERRSQMVRELSSRADAEDLTGRLTRLGARKLIQELLEAEVSETLGRDPYERGGMARGYRNGYKLRRLLTAEGALPVDLPQVRDTDKPFRSRLWRGMRKRTDVQEELVLEMYAQGLSTRDVEAQPVECQPDRRCAFAQREVGGYDVVYLFVDAIYESLREQAGLKESILATWAILADGGKTLIHLSLGNKESYEDWLEHLRDLLRRGLGTPLTVTTDGAPGLIKAVWAIWPEAERIRCWAHKMRNVRDKVPDEARSVLEPCLEAIRDASDYPTGQRHAQCVLAGFADSYPSAMRILADDLPARLAHLKLPPVHRRHVRTTNLVERAFEEERRRAKVIPRFRGVCALWRASERWRHVRFREHERLQIERYKQDRQAERQKADQERNASVA